MTESYPFDEVPAPAVLPDAEDATAQSVAGHIRAMLGTLGEGLVREEMQKTPERVARAFRFLTNGLAVDAQAWLRSALVETANPEMVLVRNVEYYALSERYLLPFFGQAHVGYIPAQYSVDFSTVIRLIDVLARRLQTQERLTRQIHDALEHELAPRGVVVALEAQHTALLMQGIEKQHARTMTYAASGAFRKPEYTGAFAEIVRGQAANRW